MRKITEKAINAFLFSEFQPFNLDNTSVTQYYEDPFSDIPSARVLRLHGHDIAHRTEGTNTISITTANLPTIPTLEHLS